MDPSLESVIPDTFYECLFPPRLPNISAMPINSPDCMVSVMCSSMGISSVRKRSSTSDMHGELAVGVQTRASDFLYFHSGYRYMFYFVSSLQEESLDRIKHHGFWF